MSRGEDTSSPGAAGDSEEPPRPSSSGTATPSAAATVAGPATVAGRAAPAGTSAVGPEGGFRGGWTDRATRRPYATRQAAVVRIAVGLIWLAILVREWPNRHGIWGPDAPWTQDAARRTVADTGGFTVLTWVDGSWWFELCYLVAVAVAGCVVLGWRTRATTVLLALSVMSFQHRNDFVLNAGENILRIAAVYLVLTRCAHVWSVDAGRTRRRRPGRRPTTEDRGAAAVWLGCGALLTAAALTGHLTPAWTVLLAGVWAVHGVAARLRLAASPATRDTVERLGNLLHNSGVLLLMAQVCLVYAAAGWYKIQGTAWQDGTAVYWSMHIGFLQPWPALTDLVTANSGIVLLLTYLTVAVQVAFPFCLLNRRVKNVLLCVIVAEHLGIAVLMGLPFFSLAMIAVDLIFLPTVWLLRVERLAQDGSERWRRSARRRRPPPDARPAERSGDRPAAAGSTPAPRGAAPVVPAATVVPAPDGGAGTAPAPRRAGERTDAGP
ncbi:HTTM domain-containing protein [Streptomyces bohaiensis]|uniref:HTTM domain-containing protein n=1 Tax=Streptomyces bohaiensis TaxID=1431344 RepID=A0ABX1CDJ1_9ACTN|nr:HTTM domain-containing protein [Streptomyces bohaiensis]NJQ14389.1 HTTM domain-containing protein [Streptomyces bohaiensis]